MTGAANFVEPVPNATNVAPSQGGWVIVMVVAMVSCNLGMFFLDVCVEGTPACREWDCHPGVEFWTAHPSR